MITTGQNSTEIDDFETLRSDSDLLQSASLPPLTAPGGRLNFSSTETNTQVTPIAQLVLTVSVYEKTSGSEYKLVKQNSSVEATLYGTKCSQKTVQKAVDLHSTLKQQGIDQPVTFRNKRGRPLVTIRSSNAPKARLSDPNEGIHVISKAAKPAAVAKQLATSDYNSILIQNKEQLQHILKFADRLGLNLSKILIPRNLLQEKELNRLNEESRIPLTALPRMLATQIEHTAEIWKAAGTTAAIPAPQAIAQVVVTQKQTNPQTISISQSKTEPQSLQPAGMPLSKLIPIIEQSINREMVALEQSGQVLRPTLLDNYRALMDLKQRQGVEENIRNEQQTLLDEYRVLAAKKAEKAQNRNAVYAAAA